MSLSVSVPAVFGAPKGKKLTLTNAIPELTRDVIFTPAPILWHSMGDVSMSRITQSYELTVRALRERGGEMVVITDDPFQDTGGALAYRPS
jgi:hypothetical protein